MIQLCVTAREERVEGGSDDTAVCDCERREQSMGQMIQLCVTAREERRAWVR